MNEASPAANAHRIVVLGAGYAGLPAALRLARQVHRYDATVTLVNASPWFVERPRLHQIATGQATAEVNLADFTERAGAELIIGRVTDIDLSQRTIRVQLRNSTFTVGYDILVYALGSVIDVDSVPGVRDHAHAFTDPQAAAALCDQAARVEASQGTLVVCGGGLTGVEAATEFAEAYPGMHVRIAAPDEPGAWLSPAGRRYLRRAMDRLGIDVVTGVTVAEVHDGSVSTTAGDALPFDLCVWAGGFGVPALARTVGLEVDERGRVLVDPTLRSPAHPEVHAIGDAAAASGAWGPSIAYGCRTGGFMGPQVADMIANTLTGRKPTTFGFRYIHQCISLGRRDALVQFVHARDETPRRSVLTGRLAVRYKEFVLGGALWTFRHPGPYLLRRRGGRRDAHRPAAEEMSADAR